MSQEVEASFERSDDESLHPAKQAAIVIGDNKVGVVGELHPKVAEAFDISETAYLFEIDVTALLPFTTSHKIDIYWHCSTFIHPALTGRW